MKTTWSPGGRRYALIMLASLGWGKLRGGVVITDVLVDNKAAAHMAIQESEGGALSPLRVQESAHSIVFRFTESPFRNRPAARLRYRLEGYDSSWHDLPLKMRVLLHFQASGQIIFQQEYFLEGETAGWSGSVETSEYLACRKEIEVPERADSVKIAFVTHGDNVGVGVIGIDAVRLAVERHGDARPTIYDLGFGQGMDTHNPHDLRSYWMSEGSVIDIAQLGVRRSPLLHPILVLRDDDAINYGNWSLKPAHVVPVMPGDWLTVEWRIAHSIGSSGPGEARYADLKPGTYTFRVAAFRPNGEATGVECALPITIVPALYRRGEFWLVLLALGIAGAALLARATEAARVRRCVAAMKYEQALECERIRIARDLHDEMGAGLSAIAMQSDSIYRECCNCVSPETGQRIQSVCQTAMELVRAVDEIVWAVNPANDTVERFVNYLTQCAEHYLDMAGLRFRFDVQRELPDVILAGAMRHSLFMAVKEAICNAAKHAKADLLWLRVRVNTVELAITVEDNGVGFDPGCLTKDGTRNGVANMRRRMEESAGRFELWSEPGQGTRVTFTVSLAQEITGAADRSTLQ